MPRRSEKNAQKQRARRRKGAKVNNKESSEKAQSPWAGYTFSANRWIDLVTKAKLQTLEKMHPKVRINQMLAFHQARSMLAYEDEEKSEEVPPLIWSSDEESTHRRRQGKQSNKQAPVVKESEGDAEEIEKLTSSSDEPPPLLSSSGEEIQKKSTPRRRQGKRRGAPVVKRIQGHAEDIEKLYEFWRLVRGHEKVMKELGEERTAQVLAAPSYEKVTSKNSYQEMRLMRATPTKAEAKALLTSLVEEQR